MRTVCSCFLLFLKSQSIGSCYLVSSVCNVYFSVAFIPSIFLFPFPFLPKYIRKKIKEDIKAFWYYFSHQLLWGFGNICIKKDYGYNNITLSPQIQVDRKHISFFPFNQHNLDCEYHLRDWQEIQPQSLRLLLPLRSYWGSRVPSPWWSLILPKALFLCSWSPHVQ